MKPSITSYSLRQLVTSKEITQVGIIDKAAELGVEGVEFSNFILEAGETKMDIAKQAKHRAADAGLPLVCYAVGANFLDDAKAAIAGVKEDARIAAEMGIPVMRHDVAYGYPPEYKGPRSFASALPLLADACAEITAYAKTLGVRTCLENHGYFAQDSQRVEALVCAVNDANFGWLVDLGNFMCADEEPYKAVSCAAPYAFHVHAKDFFWRDGSRFAPGEGWFPTRGGNLLRGTIVGHGAVPVPQCLTLLKNAGYDGYVSVEFEGMEDPMTGCRIGLENLRRFLSQ